MAFEGELDIDKQTALMTTWWSGGRKVASVARVTARPRAWSDPAARS